MARVQNIMKINKSESRIGATKAVQEQLKTTKIEENKNFILHRHRQEFIIFLDVQQVSEIFFANSKNKSASHYYNMCIIIIGVSI